MSLNLVENIRHHGFKRLLLAVSGGLDSICLAHYFIENSAALGIEWLGIAHVHHGLREGTADRDAKFVEEFAKSHDVPFFLKKLDGEALKDAEGSLEENARDARYKALVEIALNKKWRSRNGVRDDIEEGCVTIAIVTAHHAGDQAETMYMRLRRGTTLAGLRGIQEVRILSNSQGIAGLASEAPLEGVMEDRATGYNQGETSPTQKDKSLVSRLSSHVYLFRPFLNVTRKELLAYARENGLSWCEDESNADVKFARNKIRHEFLPNLEQECPGTIQQLCKIAGLADKAYAKVIANCSRSFDFAQDDTRGFPLTSASPQDDKWRSRNRVRDDNAIRTIALDKKKLNKILREYANADLSEMFRLWLTEKGFRFPIGFFYGPKEPAHVKIPVRAVYRRRSVVKIAHTVWICEFKDALSAAKFVSCEKKEKDYNEST